MLTHFQIIQLSSDQQKVITGTRLLISLFFHKNILLCFFLVI